MDITAKKQHEKRRNLYMDCFEIVRLYLSLTKTRQQLENGIPEWLNFLSIDIDRNIF